MSCSSASTLNQIVPGVTRRALDWLHKQIDQFNPLHDFPHLDEARVKATTELAFLVSTALRLDIPDLRPEWEKMAAHLIDTMDKSYLTSLIIDNQSFIMVHTILQEVCELTGRHNIYRKNLIQNVVDMRYLLSIERSPYRKMDLRYSLDRVGVKHDLPSLTTLYEATIMSQNPRLLSLQSDDVYSITHTIFYLTDMGHSLPLVGDKLEYSRWLIHTLVGMYMRTDNLDILAELLMCQYLLRTPDTYTTIVAWERLAAKQKRDGNLPSPTFVDKEYNKLTSKAAEDYCFINCYHTTQVVVMVGLLWLQKNNMWLAPSN